jgi:hypothetical protein
MELAQDRFQWWALALVVLVLNLWVLQPKGYFQFGVCKAPDFFVLL